MKPSNTPDDRQAYLWGCLDKKKEIRDNFESLGLYSEVLDKRKEPTFIKSEANELYAKVKEIAKAYLTSQRGKAPVDIKAHLAEEETFSNDVHHLGEQYGQAIWGKQEFGLTRPIMKTSDDLDWDNSKDQDTIRFYIRCWIVRLVAQDLEPPIRKKKGKSRREESFEEGEIAESSDSSDSSGVPHRAPKPPHTQSSDNRRNTGHMPGFGPLPSNLSNRATNLRVNVNQGIETGTFTKEQALKTPNKRKASDPPSGHSTGKLQRVYKGNRPEPVPSHPRERNPYSFPLSPTQPPTDPPHDMSRKHRQRESTHDPDGTYRPPRDGTAETEPFYDPEFGAKDASAADATDMLLQTNPPNFPIFPSNNEMLHNDFASPAPGPSGTYRNPLRQLTEDSVIPSTQPAPPGELLEAFQPQTTPHNPPRRNSTITEPRSKTLSPGTRQKSASRYQLWSLLIAYLNSIEEFDPAQPYNSAAEARMDTLLRQLWHDDESSLRLRLDVTDFLRLEQALNAWLRMRERLTTFQNKTQYFGQPGDEWRAHLAHLRDIQDRVGGAQARIAYYKLKGWDGEVLPYQQDTFDVDLARVFHLLTRVTGCMRVDDFESVAEFNRQLLVWVGDEEVDMDEAVAVAVAVADEDVQTEEETEEEQMELV